MIKQLAWNTFKETGDIKTYLEFKEVKNIEEKMKVVSPCLHPDSLNFKMMPYEALIRDVLEHVEDYQALVDKNRETTKRIGSWDMRMKWLMEELKENYDV